MAEAAVVFPRSVRCAIYTRKSTEEGLEKEFNSLDAQREAAEAFILSQQQEGWLVLPHKYNDGGFTGGNMERPGLRKLMSDIEDGRIDCVVVYKVDRLSRSLLDFARIMRVFEQNRVSFVSVTQQFNTSTPVGRLTLNILFSFAQFEKDIISDRTRDKKAAAKRKGKWTGGYLPLGYDLAPHGGKLMINEAEAEQVRTIFELFTETRSLTDTVQKLRQRSCHSKTWVTRQQKYHRGAEFTEQSLLWLLSNELYVGIVQYKNKTYRGEQPRIVPARLWRRAQRLLEVAQRPRPHKDRNKHEALLHGILYCGDCGRPMSHTSTCRGERRYRYYVCRAGKCIAQSLPAAPLENSVIDQLNKLAQQHRGAGLRSLRRVLESQSQQEPTGQSILQLRAVVERVTYHASSGEVSIRLHNRKENRNGSAD